MEYEFKTKPFKHQKDEFEASKDVAAHAIFWEQGTGKSKLMIDNASYLYEAGEIDAVFVVAPSGVHLNWITDEIPAHMPNRVRRQVHHHVYETKKAQTKWHAAKCTQLLKSKKFAWLAMSYDALMTEKGRQLAKKFLLTKRVFYILDEGHYIKNVTAKRTKRVIASGKYAPYRRLLTGTPVTTGPMDVYSQVEFIDDKFWTRQRLGSYTVYKHYFGNFIKKKAIIRHGPKKGKEVKYDHLVSYKRLDRLETMLSSISSRVTKDDVLDLPPKLYTKRYVELTTTQRAAYEELKSEFMLELEGGHILEAPLAIVRLLRLQQIACNYVQTIPGESESIINIDNMNPRMDMAVAELEGLCHPAIVWARFRPDIDQLMDALGPEAVRYDGAVSPDDRARAKRAFINGDAKYFVSNTAVGGTGITLTQARTVMYYSNNFKLAERLQSEDRAHRPGQEHPVNYIDVCALDTVDARIIDALRSKFDIASQITGDTLKEWL